MKRVYTALLTAVFCLASMLPAPARAVVNHVLCQPGDTFYAVFALAEDGDRPDGVMCRLSYDPDIFSVVPNMNLIGADGFSILNRQPAVLLFRVNKFVPAGRYEISATVIDSYNGDGQASANVKIAPIQVTVERKDEAGNPPAEPETQAADPEASAAEGITVQAKGLTGSFPVTVVLNDDGTIRSVTLGESDSRLDKPFLAMINNDTFLGQFAGKSAPVEEIDAVAGATHSSNSIVAAVNEAAAHMKSME